MSDTGEVNLKDLVRRAVTAPDQTTSSGATTSDLSIDEVLNLHAIGWEPVELVCGLSVFSVPAGLWNWGQGEIAAASRAHHEAFSHAIARLHAEAAAAGGHGVVGVHIERAVHPSHIEVRLVGSAVRPTGAGAINARDVFVSDLSGRDFATLMGAGWRPVGLATGASFVYAPRRAVGQVLHQQTQNVELTNFTEAMYSARESAMQRMQDAAIALKGSGVVQVQVLEGPMPFAPHAVAFVAWGTVVVATTQSHHPLTPTTVISLNDPVVTFEAQTLH